MDLLRLHDATSPHHKRYPSGDTGRGHHRQEPHAEPVAKREYNGSVPGGLKNAIDLTSTAGALSESREAESATAFSAALGD
jgi:hypothetical protein